MFFASNNAIVYNSQQPMKNITPNLLGHNISFCKLTKFIIAINLFSINTIYSNILVPKNKKVNMDNDLSFFIYKIFIENSLKTMIYN